MSSIVSLVTSPINPIIRLRDEVKRYLEKKKTKDRIVNALRDEVQAYVDTFDQIVQISETQLMPILETIENSPTVHQMNDLLEGFSQMPLAYSTLIQSFIKIAKACSEVSENQAFMESLKESSSFIYDFVERMRDTYIGKDLIKIDGRYYRFFKLYQDEIFKEVQVNGLEEIIEEMRGYVQKIKHYIRKTPFIRRKIVKKYRKNLQQLFKVTRNVTIEESDVVNLRNYIPTKLFPVAVFFEEIYMI